MSENKEADTHYYIYSQYDDEPDNEEQCKEYWNELFFPQQNPIRADINEKTARTYMDNMWRAIKQTDLSDPEKTEKWLNNKKPATKHSYLWSIITILEFENVFPDTIKRLREMVDDNKKVIDAHYKEQRKTIHENKNWMSIKELQTHNKNLRNLVRIDTNGWRQAPKNKTQNESWMISNLYTLDPKNHPPMRIDYNMEIINKPEQIQEGNNYLMVHNKTRKEFIFGDYKTEGAYGQKKIPLSRKMNAAMNLYLQNHNSKWLFPDRAGNNSTKNALQKKITKAFSSTGKTIGVSLLRHIVISEMVDTGAPIIEKEEFADKMAHSTKTQELYKKFN